MYVEARGWCLMSDVLVSCSIALSEPGAYQFINQEPARELSSESLGSPAILLLQVLYMHAGDWTQVPMLARPSLYKLSHPLGSNFFSFSVDFFHQYSLLRRICTNASLCLLVADKDYVCCSADIFLVAALSPGSRELTKDKVSISSNIPTLLCCQVIKQGKLLSHTGC